MSLHSNARPGTRQEAGRSFEEDRGRGLGPTPIEELGDRAHLEPPVGPVDLPELTQLLDPRQPLPEIAIRHSAAPTRSAPSPRCRRTTRTRPARRRGYG